MVLVVVSTALRRTIQPVSANSKVIATEVESRIFQSKDSREKLAIILWGRRPRLPRVSRPASYVVISAAHKPVGPPLLADNLCPTYSCAAREYSLSPKCGWPAESAARRPPPRPAAPTLSVSRRWLSRERYATCNRRLAHRGFQNSRKRRKRRTMAYPAPRSPRSWSDGCCKIRAQCRAA